MRMFKHFDEELVKLIKGGAVGVLPTDTVYGLACRAADQTAVEALIRTKIARAQTRYNHSRQHSTVGRARYQVSLPKGCWISFGQALLSTEIPHHLHYLSQGTGRQALRIPANKKVTRITEQDRPTVQTTSANHSGQRPANTIAEAKEYFGRMK